MKLLLLYTTQIYAVLSEAEWTNWEDVDECSTECSVGVVMQGMDFELKTDLYKLKIFIFYLAILKGGSNKSEKVNC